MTEMQKAIQSTATKPDELASLEAMRKELVELRAMVEPMNHYFSGDYNRWSAKNYPKHLRLVEAAARLRNYFQNL